MSEKVSENVQEVVNLAAVGDVEIDTAEAALEDGLEKLEMLRTVQGGDDA